MTPRRATEADIPAIQAFLRAHIQTSMFPLANLEAHGLGSDAPRGTTLWLFEDGPRLTGLYAQTNEGMGMPQLPGATPDHAKALTEEGAGRNLIGMLGATAQVRTLQTAWGLQDQPIRHDADEPGYALELSDLVVPSAPDGTSIRPVREADLPVVLPWRAAYHIETLGTPEEVAWSAAERDLQHYLVAGHHRVLVDGYAPLAMTGFNATLADVVQIGGVYTPPARRGKGLARRVLALHLQEARSEGVTRAVLFAASRGAARAYEAVGFRYVEPFTMLLFETGEGAA